MESSRLFVKNLPPSIKEADFRKHFSLGGRQVTDIKLIPNRRIGFVGYRTADEAAQAAKYLNRSYIRMSKIAVELARPIEDSSLPTATTTSVNHATKKPPTPDPESAAKDDDANNKKRKRAQVDESDPKLKEYLNVMKTGQTTTASRLEGIQDPTLQGGDVEMPVVPVDAESDDEYEQIPARKPKRQKEDAPDVVMAEARQVEAPAESPQPAPAEAANLPTSQNADATDDDWLRSRTNRLLDLVDPEDAAAMASKPAGAVQGREQASVEMATVDAAEDPASPEPAGAQSLPGSGATLEGTDADDPTEQVRRTARIFVRNLPFRATEAELRQHFEKYGVVDEVSHVFISFFIVL